MHNLQRDGHMRHAVDAGRVSYEPSSLDKGAPREAGPEQGGFVSAPEPLHAKVRLRGRRFFDHYSQATLFFQSQSAIEQQHVVKAFRFELGKVETPHITQRVVDMLQNVDISLAREVAEGLGLELGSPPEKMLDVAAPVDRAPSLSLFHEPVESAASRKVAILAADGVADSELEALQTAISKAGAVARIVAPHGGWLQTQDGKDCRVDHSLSTVSSTMFDAIAVPGGTQSVTALAQTPGLASEAVRILVGQVIAHENDAATTGILVATDRPLGDLEALEFVRAVAKHRHWKRAVAPQLDA
jgi:catalase